MVYAVSEILFIQTCNRPKQGNTHIWRQLFTIFLPLNFSGNVCEYFTKAYNFEVLKVIGARLAYGRIPNYPFLPSCY